MWKMFNTHTTKEMKLETVYCGSESFEHILGGKKTSLFQVIGGKPQEKDFVRVISRSKDPHDPWEGSLIISVGKSMGQGSRFYISSASGWFYIERFRKPGRYRMKGSMEDLWMEYAEKIVRKSRVLTMVSPPHEVYETFIDELYPQFKKFPAKKTPEAPIVGLDIPWTKPKKRDYRLG